MTPKKILTFFHFLYNRLIPCFLIGVALVGLYCFTQRLEPLALDMELRGTAQPAEKSPVVLVLIDDESIKRLIGRFGPLFWDRSVYVDIFKRIQAQQPAVMVFDAHLMNMNRREDPAIFEALQAFPHLISGLALDTPSALNTNHPLYYHLKLGVVNTAVDPNDGCIRSLQPVFHNTKGIYPALSLSAAMEYLQATQPGSEWATDTRADRLLIFPETKPSFSRQFPLNRQGELLLRWYQVFPNTENSAVGQSHPSIPLWAFYEPHHAGINLNMLKNKIVMLGASSAIYRDTLKTPMHERQLGVDIHATAVDNLLLGESLSIVPRSLQFILLLLFSGSVCLMAMRLKQFGRIILVTASLMALYLYLAFFQLTTLGNMMDLVTPELFMLVGLFLGMSLRAMSHTRQVRAMEQSLAQLVSQSVFQEIRRVGYVLKPGGQRMEITSLFVDIRNFSAMAENMPPAEITQLLNAFYTAVEKVTFAHRGTVDKFMGDGILVIFGAPISIQTHADAALNAAMDILSETDGLIRQWQAQYGYSVEIGISLNSGPVFVGFLGPVYKLEYTAIGDTVNLCVRLQEQNKQFHTRLVVSEYTAQRLRHPEKLSVLGEVSVKGREASLQIYGLAEL